MTASKTYEHILKMPSKFHEYLQYSKAIDFAVYHTQKWLEEPNHHFITYQDKTYPKQLKELSDPPLILFVKGNIKAINTPQIAIVGTRNNSHYGKIQTQYFTQALIEKNYTITSGLARGIDSIAHTTAVKHQKPTLAVLASGIDHIYPKSNARLAHEITIHDGALMSEHLLGTIPERFHFPKRNRLISGLSLGTLIIEARQKSGSLITAQTALEQNKEVFAVPGNIDSPHAQGCLNLIQNGAKLVMNVNDILSEINPLMSSSNNSKTHTQTLLFPEMNDNYHHYHHLSENQQNILEHLKQAQTQVDLDELQILTELPLENLLHDLLQLEIQNWIENLPGGFTVKVFNPSQSY